MTKGLMAKHGTQVDYVEVNAGHWLNLEQSDEVNEAMRRWLETLALSP